MTLRNAYCASLVGASYRGASKAQSGGAVTLTGASLAGLLLTATGSPRAALHLAVALPHGEAERQAVRYLHSLALTEDECAPDTLAPSDITI